MDRTTVAGAHGRIDGLEDAVGNHESRLQTVEGKVREHDSDMFGVKDELRQVISRLDVNNALQSVRNKLQLAWIMFAGACGALFAIILLFAPMMLEPFLTVLANVFAKVF